MKQIFVLKKDNYSIIYDYLSQIEFDGKMKITIEENKKNRSNAQNSLFHMWCKIIGSHTGYMMHETKAILKNHLLGYNEIINKKTGEVIRELKSTSELNTKEYTKFLESIEVLAMTYYNIKLPRPEDIYRGAMD